MPGLLLLHPRLGGSLHGTYVRERFRVCVAIDSHCELGVLTHPRLNSRLSRSSIPHIFHTCDSWMILCTFWLRPTQAVTCEYATSETGCELPA